jgi:hypothetical protein
MTTDEMQLLREFRREVPEPDEETVRRAYVYATSSSRTSFQERLLMLSVPPVRLRFALPAAAVICAAVVAAVFTGAFGGSNTHHPNQSVADGSVGAGALRPGITTLGNDNPFGASGKLVTLQQFVADKAKEGYSVPLPNSPLANSHNVGNVWENTATGEVIVYYPSSGIELNYGGTGLDYTGIPANDIQTINGVRAIVFPAGSPESYFSSASLPIPSGHLVDLLSKGPVSDLVSVAQTMTVTGR